MVKKQAFATIVLSSVLIAGLLGSSTHATGILSTLYSTTIDQITAGITKIQEMRAEQDQKIAHAKERLEQSKTTADEIQAKADQAKAEAEQAKLEVQQKIEEKKLEWKQSAEAKAAEAKANAAQKLADNKKQSCQEVVGQINTILTDTKTRRESTGVLITQVTDASLEYVKTNALVIENYDALVAAVDTARAASELANQSLSKLADFDCNATDPYGYVAQFKAIRSETLEAQKVYRDSVKDLLVAIKAAAKADAAAAKEAAKKAGE